MEIRFLNKQTPKFFLFLALFFIMQSFLTLKAQVWTYNLLDRTEQAHYIVRKALSVLTDETHDFVYNFNLPIRPLDVLIRGDGVSHFFWNQDGLPLLFQAVKSTWAQAFILFMCDIHRKYDFEGNRFNPLFIKNSAGQSIEEFVDTLQPKTNYEKLFFAAVKKAILVYKTLDAQNTSTHDVKKKIITVMEAFFNAENAVCVLVERRLVYKHRQYYESLEDGISSLSSAAYALQGEPKDDEAARKYFPTCDDLEREKVRVLSSHYLKKPSSNTPLEEVFKREPYCIDPLCYAD